MRIIRNTKIWKNLYFDKAINGEKYILMKISRNTGELVFTQTYDIASNGYYSNGRSGIDLTDELNKTSNEYLIALFTSHASTLEHRKHGLPEAVYRCGGTESAFYDLPHRSGYILIGVPGLDIMSGRGHGHEECSSLDQKSNTIRKLSLSFIIAENKCGYLIVEELTSGRKYLKSSMADRTNEENKIWKMYRSTQMLTYWKLSLMEYSELKKCFAPYSLPSYIIVPLCTLIVLFGLGHLFTKVGRSALYITGWKLINFIPIVLGIWSDDIVNMYHIHETVHQSSTVFHDPRVLDRIAKDMNIQKKDFIPAKLLHSDNSEYSNNKQMHFDNRKKYLTHIQEQSQLKDEYGLVLYGLIAPRATLLQVFPYVSMLSIFSSLTAADPIFLKNAPNLKKNLLQPILKDPVTHNNKLATEHFDYLWEIKQNESQENEYDIPLVPTDTVLSTCVAPSISTISKFVVPFTSKSVPT